MTELVYRGGADRSPEGGERRAQPHSTAGTALERVTVDPLRAAPSPIDWVRMRLAERETRRADAAHTRIAQRMETLGDQWRILDLKLATGSDRSSFLAVGPGGVFAVTVKEHGRSRVAFAGDVVQIDGRRPKYVQEARQNAKVAAEALTRSAGVSIPVMPVLAFAGTGQINFYGMPKGCLVTSYRELGRVLNARGRRMVPETVDKVFSVAAHPATWINPPYVALADRYRWYPESGGDGTP